MPIGRVKAVVVEDLPSVEIELVGLDQAFEKFDIEIAAGEQGSQKSA